MLIEFPDVGVQEFIGLLNAGNIRKPQLYRKAGLKSVKHSFNPPFCLCYAGGADFNAQLLTGIAELGKGVLFHGGLFGTMILKDCAVIRKELIRNAIVGEYLMQDVVITVESLLFIKPGAGDGAGGVIDSDMQLGFVRAKPKV